MKKNFNPAKTLSGATDWGIFIVASLMLYSKTSEVFAHFAPERFLGFTDAAILYGVICALLVEGVLVMAKLSIGNSENSMAYLWNIFMIVVTWGMSAAMQLTDGFLLSTQTLTAQQQQYQDMGSWLIPLVPSLILAITLVKTIMAHTPESDASAGAKTSAGAAQLARQSERMMNAILDRFAPAKDAQPMRTFGLEVQNARTKKTQHIYKRNDLTAADKDAIATMNATQVKAQYGVSKRTAQYWIAHAKEGKL